MPGPPKVPTAIKRLRGTDRADRRAANEAQPARGLPAAPDFLGAAAKKIWKRRGPGLAALGVLTEIDAHAFGRLCEAWARYEKMLALIRQLDAEVNDLGEFAKYPSGVIQIHAAAIARDRAAEECYRLEQQFGLTPAARARINVESSAPKVNTNPFANIG